MSFVVVPGAIVLVCLTIAVGIGWLTYDGSSPEELVDAIEHREGNDRWRAGVQLAGMLADPEHETMRRDGRLAKRLTEVLRRELELGDGHQEDVMLQAYLCRALGEFELDVSLSVLVEATGTNQVGAVRRSAIEGIALLADSLNTERVVAEPGLIDSLFAASRDNDPLVRLSAAYTLGVLGGAQVEERLAAMLLDENALVRYNAATGLARWGNAAAIDVLVEMLDPDQQAAFGEGGWETLSGAQPELVHVNALEAIKQLLEVNTDVPLGRVRGAVKRLGEETESRAVRAKVEGTQELL